MFSEILKIVPKLDNKDLDAMQKSLQSRFTKLTKNFGKGLVNVLKGGGIAGIALGLIDKLLNPLKEVQEAIDRTLKTSDDLSTNAAQFNTSSGKLFKLVQLAKSTGLDQDNLFLLISKFQTAVAQARANPNDQSVNSVRNFVGQEDTAEAFFGFISQLQKMNRDQQILIQQQVFGEKQILKMAEFLQKDFTQAARDVGIDKITAQKLTGSIDKLSGLADLSDALEARRGTFDIINKSGVINESMIRNRDKSEKIALQRENARIQSYNDLASITQTVDKIMALVESGVALLGSFISKVTPLIERLVNSVEKVLKSPLVRGVKGLLGGKGD